jgi:hypothetical protein
LSAQREERQALETWRAITDAILSDIDDVVERLSS